MIRPRLRTNAVEQDTNMDQRLETALQLAAIAAFIAVTLTLVTTSLTLLSTQCARGAPLLPAIFPCFAG
jgi:Co/Zn/Cd efflux system component